MQGNPFDAGVIVEDFPGYRWPLAEWRQYYMLNVQGTGAISHERFIAESPKAYAALAAADAQYQTFRETMNNPQAASVLMEAIRLITAGHVAPLSEVVGHLAAHKPVTLSEEMTTGDAPQALQADGHKHAFAKGDAKTGEAAGHTHDVGSDGQCADAAGHNHGMMGG